MGEYCVKWGIASGRTATCRQSVGRTYDTTRHGGYPPLLVDTAIRHVHYPVIHSVAIRRGRVQAI